jgi:hypothetical protein
VGLDLPSLPGLPPPLAVGRVFQRFSSVAEGRVANIIEFSVPLLLDAQRGATFTVDARCGGGDAVLGCVARGRG